VLKDPDPKEGTLAETDIETLTVVTKKEEIAKHGYSDIDKIIFIITKEFFKRPEEVKRIPTTKQMERKSGKWYLSKSASPYSGQFIDYFFNGKKQGDGTLKDGVLEGRRNVYYPNGNLSYFTHYVNGVETGESKRVLYERDTSSGRKFREWKRRWALERMVFDRPTQATDKF
jgi:antitoxin component YwqK of YwqJK toxin-antitoxin module